MMTGTYYHQIDEKMRIRIPAKLKAEIGENPFITIGSNKSLLVFKKEEGQKFLEDVLSRVSVLDTKKNKPLRMLSSRGFFAEEDKQGRIILPPHLIKHANITKSIVTIGALNRAEIWSEEVWNDYCDDDEMSFDECLDLLLDGTE